MPREAGRHAERPIETLHVDAVGRQPSRDLDGNQQALLVTCGNTKYRWCFLSRSKREHPICLMELIKRLDRIGRFGRVAELRLDGGMEILTSDFKAWCANQGIALMRFGFVLNMTAMVM